MILTKRPISWLKPLRCPAFLVAACSACGLAHADDPIIIFAASGGIPPQQIEAGSNKIRDLVEDLTKRTDEFRDLVAVDFKASLTYLGVENAILLDFSADGTAATVTIPSANFQQTFTAEDSDLLSDDLEDFLTSEGSKTLAELRRFVNARSPVGISDGNPISTTGIIVSNWGYSQLQNHLSSSTENRQSGTKVFFKHGSYEAGSFTGTTTNAQLSINYDMVDSVGLRTNFNFNHQLVQESIILGGGGAFGLSFDFIEDEHFRWSLVPFTGGMFRISEDLASGGAVFNYGISSLSSYRLSDRCILAAHLEISDFVALPLDIEGFELDSEIDQQIFGIGLGLKHTVYRSLQVVASLTSYQYLQEAAVDQWITSEAGIHLDLYKGLSCGASYELTKGSNFRSDSLALNLGLQF